MTPQKPKLKTLKLAQLTVDRTVQRALDENRARRIAEEFDLTAFGVIHVSARPGEVFHIIDGQHRVAGAKMAGHEDATVPCLVYVDLTKADEATLFRQLNNTRRVQAIDKFRVRVEEGDLVAVQLNTMLHNHGWRVEASKASGAFMAVAAVENLFNGGRVFAEGPHLGACDTTIAILTRAWGHNSDGVRGELVNGLGNFVLRHGAAVDQPKLVSELATFEGGPLGMVGNARTLRQVSGGNVVDAMAEIVTNLQNKGRRANRMPAWGGAKSA